MSSAQIIGEDKDSTKRQRLAVTSYAQRTGYDLWASSLTPASRAPIPSRGFSERLDGIEGNGVRVVIVEDASRFARDLIT